ncbi:MAG: tetratricopeptide repeat protein, partial [Deltaproteobacteria bacterium]|nr:tetratricopeptide repeat protein [Deltaproteobacteria bacterium]
YYKGMDLYYAGQYEEAKKAWEEALKSDQHNLYILRAIDGANEKIETYKEKK